jgi:hypothetical protein
MTPEQIADRKGIAREIAEEMMQLVPHLFAAAYGDQDAMAKVEYRMDHYWCGLVFGTRKVQELTRLPEEESDGFPGVQ